RLATGVAISKRGDQCRWRGVRSLLRRTTHNPPGRRSRAGHSPPEAFVMVSASELKQGMALRIQGQVYKVLEVEAKGGTAKLGGVVKTKLSNVATGRMWEPHFRPQERMEDLEVERYTMEFLFTNADTCTFMNPD